MTTHNVPMMVSSRMTASERRTAVLAAAITEFARSGYAGTSTDAIATRAGISQPYLFRLFGTKKDLFVATYELVSDRIIAAMTRAGTGLEGVEQGSGTAGPGLALREVGDEVGERLGGEHPGRVGVQLDEPEVAVCGQGAQLGAEHDIGRRRGGVH